MTYKQIVDQIQGAVNDHGMLADFGYGQLSDIKVLDSDGDGANYPYAFLTPAGVTRNGQSTVYGFSLIIMEMANTPHDVLTIQSDTIGYLNDIIGVLRYDSTFGGDVILNNSIQVFRERFQDDVAGATASFQIQIADPINICDAPVAEWFKLGLTVDFNDLINTQYESMRIDGCATDMTVQQWKWVFDLNLIAEEDLTDWDWKWISVVRWDSETGTHSIIDRIPVVIDNTIGSTATIQWTSEFDFMCPLSDTDEDRISMYLGDWRDDTILTDALTIQGTLNRYYKTVIV